MHAIAAITLTTPAMLWGMAAAGLPIAAHLMNRRVRRRVTFPSLVLLHEAAASQSRLFRLRRLILLALRCLVIVLIAWAFARPVWIDRAAAAGAGEGGGALVIVLDVSPSMGQLSGGVRAIDTARNEAAALIDGLSAGEDAANVVLAAATPKPLYPEPIPNFSALRREIDQVEPSQQRADLAAAIAMARAMLAEVDGPRRLVVLSDMQQTNWADVALGVGFAESGVSFAVRDVTDGSAVNTTLARPRIVPGRPIVNRPATVRVVAANYADRPRDVRLTLSIDGAVHSAQRLALKAGERREARFDVTIDKPGEHRAVIAVDGDDLPADDRAHLVIDAAPRVPIALIADDDPRDPRSSSYYLLRALSPAADESNALDVAVWRSDEVAAARLGAVEAALIGAAGPLGDDAAAALRDYIAAGGGVVMFCGDGAVGANAAALRRAAGERAILPWQPIDRRAGRVWRIGEGAWSSTALASFDEVSRLALQQIIFTSVYEHGERREGAFDVLRYDDQRPALSVMPFGSGRMMLANFTAAPGGGQLAKHGSFVALMHGVVDALRPMDDAVRDTHVGEPVTLAVDLSAAPAAQGLSVMAPSGRTVAAPSERRGAAIELNLPRTTEAGFYEAVADGQAVRSVAVNIDEREGDLRQFRPDDLRRRLGAVARSVGDDGASDHDADASRVGTIDVARAGALNGERGGLAIWPWLVIAALGVFAVELVLLRVWRR